MQKRLSYGTLLLLTSTLVAPAALAQTSGGPAPVQTAPPSTQTQTTPPPAADRAAPAPAAGDPQDKVEVSSPGYDPSAGEDIVVIGRNIPNAVRATPQVISVLSSADIARTGEGDIAGALSHVTGLSVVGNGFVYVRGLGDRYSSSLLNGSPLPSPEPLRRSVPLDIFPTGIIGSALVQKTYSVSYPGEFGGGVINLTTKAIPEKDFITFGGAIEADDRDARTSSAIPMRAAIPTGSAMTTAPARCPASSATRRTEAASFRRSRSRSSATPPPRCFSATTIFRRISPAI